MSGSDYHVLTAAPFRFSNEPNIPVCGSASACECRLLHYAPVKSATPSSAHHHTTHHHTALRCSPLSSDRSLMPFLLFRPSCCTPQYLLVHPHLMEPPRSTEEEHQQAQRNTDKHQGVHRVHPVKCTFATLQSAGECRLQQGHTGEKAVLLSESNF